MKIALIVPGGVDRTGTVRVIPVLLALIERLAHEHEVHVFALRQEPRPSTYPLLGATVHNIGSRPRRLRTLAALAREHRKNPFQVLHAFWALPQGLIGALASRMLRVPMIVHLIGADLAALHDLEYGALRTTRGRLLLRFAVGQASCAAVESDDMRRRAREAGIVAEQIPLGVDLQRWPPVAPRVSAGHRLLQVGGLNRVKDHATMLQALRILSGRGIQFQIEIAGVDTLNGEIQAKARALGLSDRVTFHGQLPHSELRTLYLQADALVVSSRQESAPVAALEAAICGVPVVGSAVGYLADWSPTAALGVPPRQPEALADAIAALLADPERRLCIARNAQARALAHDADWTAQRVSELYCQMIS